MKRILTFTALIALSGFFNVSCETTADGAGRPGGISGSGGATRESLYQAQDRAMRQLAY